MQRYARELAISLAIGALLLLMYFMAPAFFRPEHLRDKLVANAPVLIVAIGMTLVIVARQIDISVGSQFSVCGVIAALAAQNDLPLAAVVCIAVLCGALMGALNGWFVAYLKLPSDRCDAGDDGDLSREFAMVARRRIRARLARKFAMVRNSTKRWSVDHSWSCDESTDWHVDRAVAAAGWS